MRCRCKHVNDSNFRDILRDNWNFFSRSREKCKINTFLLLSSPSFLSREKRKFFTHKRFSASSLTTIEFFLSLSLKCFNFSCLTFNSPSKQVAIPTKTQFLFSHSEFLCIWSAWYNQYFLIYVEEFQDLHCNDFHATEEQRTNYVNSSPIKSIYSSYNITK